MKEISDEEKLILEKDAFESFLEQFKPYDDQYSVFILEILFEVLLGKKSK